MDVAPYQRKRESGHGTDLGSEAINQVASYSKKLPYDLSVGLKPAEIPLGPAPHIFTVRACRCTFSHFTFFDVHFKDSTTKVHGNGCILNKLPLIRIKVCSLAGGNLWLDKQLMASQLKETVLSKKCRHTERGSHVTLFPLPRHTEPFVVRVEKVTLV